MNWTIISVILQFSMRNFLKRWHFWRFLKMECHSCTKFYLRRSRQHSMNSMQSTGVLTELFMNISLIVMFLKRFLIHTPEEHGDSRNLFFGRLPWKKALKNFWWSSDKWSKMAVPSDFSSIIINFINQNQVIRLVLYSKGFPGFDSISFLTVHLSLHYWGLRCRFEKQQ